MTRPSPVAVDSNSSEEVVHGADTALRIVRVILGVLSIFVVVGYSPLESEASLLDVGLTVALIVAGTVVLNHASLRLVDGPLQQGAMQALDIAGAVGLVIALDAPSAHTSWALLMIPVVAASVRLNTAAVIASWASGSLAYVVADRIGWISPVRGEELYVQVPGIMLAVAVTLGMLARWMREGWEIQNELTTMIAERERRLATLEAASREMMNSPERVVLKICTERLIQLGFEAATAHRTTDRLPYLAVGNGAIVADVEPDFEMEPGTAVVTMWSEGQLVRSQSAAVLEPRTNIVITGWRTGPLKADLAESMVALVEQASAAIEAARIVGRLRSMASRDPLTGTLNRRALDHLLAKHAAEEGTLGVALVDLDGFKAINDTYGHPIGDHVLTLTARRLAEAVGSQGILARYGGDEFAIVFPDSSVEESCRLGERVLEIARQAVSIGQVELNLGLSVGVAVARTPHPADQLVAAADRALYTAKNDGRGRAVVADLQSSPAEARRFEADTAHREDTPLDRAV